MKDFTMQHGDEKGKVFVGGLSWNTNNSSMLKYFSRYGEVIDCVVMKNPETGKSRGFGFVTFKDPTCVEVVLSSKCHILDGRQIDPKACNPRSMNKGSKSLENSKKKIFIGGLPINVTEEELVDHFSKYGPVMEVVIMLDQQKQRSRGFGFLTFESEDCVERVVEDHFLQINGKQVEVKKAEPRDIKLFGDSSMSLIQGDIPSGISSYPIFLAPPSHFNFLHLPSPTNSISLISPLGLGQTPDNLFSAASSPVGQRWCSAGGPGLHLVNPGSPMMLIASDSSGTGLAMTPTPTGMAYQVWSPVQTPMTEHVAFLSPTPSNIACDGHERHSYTDGCQGDVSFLTTMYHFGDGPQVIPCTNNGMMGGPLNGINTNNTNSNIAGLAPAILAVQPALRAHASTPAGFHPYRR